MPESVTFLALTDYLKIGAGSFIPLDQLDVIIGSIHVGVVVRLRELTSNPKIKFILRLYNSHATWVEAAITGTLLVEILSDKF